MSDRFGGEPGDGGESGETVEGVDGVPVDSASFLAKYKVPIGLVVFVALLRPVIASDAVLGYNAIANTMLITILFVAAFNLLFGFAGLLSFGHAMFLGFGVYVTAIVTMNGLPGLPAGGTLTFLVGAVLALAFSAAFSYLLGLFIVRKGEIYFAMLTLAVSQAVYFIALRDPGGLTGGSNGLTGGTLPAFVEQTRGEIEVVLGGLSVDWYWVVGVVFLLAMLALWQVLRSPFGRTLIAIRENEALARAMGIDVARYKVVALTLSGTFAALAGVLLEVNDNGAAIENLNVTTSGDVVLMAVLGGIHFFFGPIAGAFTWLFAEDFLTGFETLALPLAEVPMVTLDLTGLLQYWQFLLGALFVVVVMTSPKNGIWGFVRGGAARVRSVVEGVRG
jgi:branched-chain amino acid transport system permease protein